MDYIIREIKMPGRGFYDLGLTGDWHYGGVACATDLLAEAAKMLGTRCHGWLGMGDYHDAIGRTDRRWDDKNLDPELFLTSAAKGGAGGSVARYHELCSDRLAEMFAPAAHNCLGLLSGNHEVTISTRYDRDLMYRLTEGMRSKRGGKTNPNLQALDYEAVIVLRFTRHQKGGSSLVKLFLHHGAGAAATKGGQANKLLSMATVLPEADAFICGHYHREDFWIEHPMKLHFLDKNGSDPQEIVPMEGRQLFVQVQSFYRTYVKGSSNYASRRLYRPTGLGARVLRIWPFRRFYHEVAGERVLDLATPVIEPLWNVKDETQEV